MSVLAAPRPARITTNSLQTTTTTTQAPLRARSLARCANTRSSPRAPAPCSCRRLRACASRPGEFMNNAYAADLLHKRCFLGPFIHTYFMKHNTTLYARMKHEAYDGSVSHSQLQRAKPICSLTLGFLSSGSRWGNDSQRLLNERERVNIGNNGSKKASDL